MNEITKMAYPTEGGAKEELISKVLYHIVNDAIKYGDFEASAELLGNVPIHLLMNFLNEEQRDWTAFCRVDVADFWKTADGGLRTYATLYYDNFSMRGYIYLPKEADYYFKCSFKDTFFDDYDDKIFEKIIFDAVAEKFDEVYGEF